MEVKIRTLTPLWTGSVDGKVDRIHETGILGSLRWWMEVLVRGMGGKVCDPTEQKCSYKNGLCEVCKIFGAEGWKRRFRLEIVQDNTKPDEALSFKIEVKRHYKDKEDKTKTRTSTWYFPKDKEDKPRFGIFTIHIQSLHPDFKPEVIGGLIQFIADWAALGARPQMGFGVIQVMDDNFSQRIHLDTQPLYDWLMTTVGSDTYSDLPSLKNIFLAKIQTKNSSSSFNEKDTFNLKYDLRQLFRTDGDTSEAEGKTSKPILKKDKDKGKKEEELRHFVMGAAPKDSGQDRASEDNNDKRMAAKIKISRPYIENGKSTMRVWGWVPEIAEVCKNDWDREKIVGKIHQYLATHYNLSVWREMNSSRDSVIPNENNARPFLGNLCQLP